MEIAIPFKSLRYRPGRAQIWGFNARRVNRAKNEMSFLTRSRAASGRRAFPRVAGGDAGRHRGAAGLAEHRDQAVRGVEPASDRTSAPRVQRSSADVGVDVKYGLTQNLTADFTYNTDFAQVEADEQQVNLTRFSLFFPEKREFFLENRGSSASAARPATVGDMPIMFHSRRIGFDQGRAVPIEAGGALTGRVGRVSLGVLNIQADDEPARRRRATNFSVVRLKRDILRRSSVGLIATGRSQTPAGPGSNQAYGVDGTFAFFDNLTFNTYWARTQTDGFRRTTPAIARSSTTPAIAMASCSSTWRSATTSIRTSATCAATTSASRRRGFASARGRASSAGAAVHLVHSRAAYIENSAGRVETRTGAEFGIEFQNSDPLHARHGAPTSSCRCRRGSSG